MDSWHHFLKSSFNSKEILSLKNATIQKNIVYKPKY